MGKKFYMYDNLNNIEKELNIKIINNFGILDVYKIYPSYDLFNNFSFDIKNYIGGYMNLNEKNHKQFLDLLSIILTEEYNFSNIINHYQLIINKIYNNITINNKIIGIPSDIKLIDKELINLSIQDDYQLNKLLLLLRIFPYFHYIMIKNYYNKQIIMDKKLDFIDINDLPKNLSILNNFFINDYNLYIQNIINFYNNDVNLYNYNFIIFSDINLNRNKILDYNNNNNNNFNINLLYNENNLKDYLELLISLYFNNLNITKNDLDNISDNLLYIIIAKQYISINQLELEYFRNIIYTLLIYDDSNIESIETKFIDDNFLNFNCWKIINSFCSSLPNAITSELNNIKNNLLFLAKNTILSNDNNISNNNKFIDFLTITDIHNDIILNNEIFYLDRLIINNNIDNIIFISLINNLNNIFETINKLNNNNIFLISEYKTFKNELTKILYKLSLYKIIFFHEKTYLYIKKIIENMKRVLNILDLFKTNIYKNLLFSLMFSTSKMNIKIISNKIINLENIITSYELNKTDYTLIIKEF